MTTPLIYMTRALELAEQGRYTVAPNPMVGCVIVKDHKIIGEGFHQKAGGAHAEIAALQQAGEDAKDATAYITLEPCCHYGRTPPCTLALIKAGIKKVVIACNDPNALVAGKGIAQLEAAGIDVEIGLCEIAATALNEIFFHYIQTKRPFVIAKWAISLDGKTITATTDSRHISSTTAQHDAHDLRQQINAILIGANTARLDNPQLTARFNLHQLSTQPIRIILSHDGKLPPDLAIFSQALSGKTLIAIAAPKIENETIWQERGIEILYCQTQANGDIDLKALLERLGKRAISSLLVEGGENVRQQFFSEALVNRIQVYISPCIISSLEKKQYVSNVNLIACGNDFKITATIPMGNI